MASARTSTRAYHLSLCPSPFHYEHQHVRRTRARRLYVACAFKAPLFCWSVYSHGAISSSPPSSPILARSKPALVLPLPPRNQPLWSTRNYHTLLYLAFGESPHHSPLFSIDTTHNNKRLTAATLCPVSHGQGGTRDDTLSLGVHYK